MAGCTGLHVISSRYHPDLTFYYYYDDDDDDDDDDEKIQQQKRVTGLNCFKYFI